MNSLWPVYSPTANETFDVPPTSRFLVQCNDQCNDLATQTLDENYGPGITSIYEGGPEFYQKNDDYSYVNAAAAAAQNYIFPSPLIIPTNFMTHETNASPLSSSGKKSLSTIHSPTPSLVTDDEQDPRQTSFLYHDFQVQIPNEPYNNQRQQPSPDFRDNFNNYTKGSPPDSHNLQNASQQPPSPVSPDNNGLGIVQITPPPSHQTTPRQKKRRVSRKPSLNSTSIFTENPQTRQSPPNIFTTANTQNSTDHAHEYDFCSNDRNSYAFSPSASSSSRRNSVSGTKRRSIDDPDETPEERRRKFLERNRIAASKCRQKKKAAMQELKERADTISSRNTTLHAFVNDLREELLTLKNQLLAHRNCNCNILQEYIRKDAHANTPTTITQKN